MLPKRTIEEWLTVAKVSRGAAHIFVEGSTDARVLNDACGYPENVDFRTADEISLEPKGATPVFGGHKLRLLHLAERVAKNSIDNIRCFIDSDFAIFTSYFRKFESVWYTSAANLPSIVFEYGFIFRFLFKGYGYRVSKSEWIVIEDTLTFAFICRFLNGSRANPRSAPSVGDHLSIKSGVLTFDKNSYVKMYFQAKDDRATSIITDVNDIKDWVRCRPKSMINSNDLFDLLYSLLRKRSKISGSTSREAVRGAFFAAYPADLLAKSEFSHIVLWVSTIN